MSHSLGNDRCLFRISVSTPTSSRSVVVFVRQAGSLRDRALSLVVAVTASFHIPFSSLFTTIPPEICLTGTAHISRILSKNTVPQQGKSKINAQTVCQSTHTCHFFVYKKNSVALVRERTIPTERPPPVGEVTANFCG